MRSQKSMNTDYILQKEYDNVEKVLYEFNTLLDDVRTLEREIQVLEQQGAGGIYRPLGRMRPQ